MTSDTRDGRLWVYVTPSISAALKGRQVMLWTILVILLVLWLLGLIGSIGGAAIHLLLVIALIVLVVQFLGRRSSTG